MKVDNKKVIMRELRKEKSGLTITDMVRITKINRSNIRTSLAFLEGADKIEYNKIGMAKVYRIKK